MDRKKYKSIYISAFVLSFLGLLGGIIAFCAVYVVLVHTFESIEIAGDVSPTLVSGCLTEIIKNSILFGVSLLCAIISNVLFVIALRLFRKQDGKVAKWPLVVGLIVSLLVTLLNVSVIAGTAFSVYRITEFEYNNEDMGIARRLPHVHPTEESNAMEYSSRNVLSVMITSQDEVLVNGEKTDVSTLKNTVKVFLSNPENRDDLSEKELKDIDNLGPYPVSKGVVCLHCEPATSYVCYLRVQDEFLTAINELRNEVARKEFGKPYEELDALLRNAIEEAVPMAVDE